MSAIVFVGGVHGVGKTTLMEELIQRNTEWCIYDPGELFWRYSIERKLLSPDTIEEIIAESISGLIAPVTLVNWHYVAWTPDRGYIPQIARGRWSRAMRKSRKKPVGLLAVWADAETVLSRRCRDVGAGAKKRKTDLACVHAEIAAQEKSLLWHYEALAKYVPRSASGKIDNAKLDDAIEASERFISALL